MVLSAEIIRSIDDMVTSGVGGFRSRDELVEEALRSYLLELGEVAAIAAQSSETEPKRIFGSAMTPTISQASTSTLAVIAAPSQGFRSDGDDIVLEDAPLLGLHNRDWPSFWALGRLAFLARDNWVELRSYLDGVTEEAWQLAAELKLTADAGKTATQMLPTNPEKKQSSDTGFQNFAVLSVSNKPSRTGLHKVSGPLAVWRAVAFSDIGTNTKIAITAVGWDLLNIVEGLSPKHPHNEGTAKRFFDFLKSNSPSDWWGFETVLREVSHAPARDALLAKMEPARDWSYSIAASTTQGYIARSREWGLVEPKLINGTYKLTDFGRDILQNV